jgi:hypothetical protein
MRRTDSSTGRVLAMVMVGAVAVSLAVSPAAAHFRPKIGHLFKHFRIKADPLYINVGEAVKDIAAGAVTAGDIAPGAVTPDQITAIPAVRVFRTTLQSTPDDTFVAVSFDGEAFDTAGLHDSVNPTRLTAPRAGLYQITGVANFFVNPNGSRVFQILKNGTDRLVSDTVLPPDEDDVVSTLAQLSAGEYVELFVKQSSGGPLNVACCPAGTTPVLVMHWIGPA